MKLDIKSYYNLREFWSWVLRQHCKISQAAISFRSFDLPLRLQPLRRLLSIVFSLSVLAIDTVCCGLRLCDRKFEYLFCFSLYFFVLNKIAIKYRYFYSIPTRLLIMLWSHIHYNVIVFLQNVCGYPYVQICTCCISVESFYFTCSLNIITSILNAEWWRGEGFMLFKVFCAANKISWCEDGQLAKWQIRVQLANFYSTTPSSFACRIAQDS